MDFNHYNFMQLNSITFYLKTLISKLSRKKTFFKGARTYCIINEQDQPAANECNRKLYYRQKLEKLFVHPRMGLGLYWTILLHVFQKVTEDF